MGQFKVGEPRPVNAGRKKGSLNRRTLAKAALNLEQVLIEAKFNPSQKILDLMPLLEPRDQVKACLELLSFIQAKPKAIEMPDVQAEPIAPEEDPSMLETSKLLAIVRGENK